MSGDDNPKLVHEATEGVEDGRNAADEEQGADEQEDEENANTMNGGYNNMNYGGASGDYNQMQMMMAMQNGMNPSNFGGFPMMGKFASPLSAISQKTTANPPDRNAWNELGPYANAEHVHERWLPRHGHERHGWLWGRVWPRLQ